MGDLSNEQVLPALSPASVTPIAVAYGDGIGPEIMDAVLRVLDAANAPLRYDVVEMGEKLYRQGYKSGSTPEAWATIRRNHILLKAPITTPQGGGYKSL
ncbi:MAG: isocitrate/isopropylmalate family dehydrogenase, partial [Caldilinea sp.]